jgi:hypothetical protein
MNRIRHYQVAVLEKSFLIDENANRHLDDFLTALVACPHVTIIVPEETTNTLEAHRNSAARPRSELAGNAIRFIRRLKERHKSFVIAKKTNGQNPVEELASRLNQFRQTHRIIVFSRDSDLLLRLREHESDREGCKEIHVCFIKGNGKIADLPMRMPETSSAHGFVHPLSSSSKGYGIPVRTTIPSIGDSVLIGKQPHVLRETIGVGGEATVYALDRTHVVKIYHQSELSTVRQEKLELMTRKPVRHPGIIWPEETVTNMKGEVVGFSMRRVEGHPLLSLFGGKTGILRIGPQWKRVDIVNLVMSTLKLIWYLHDKNILVGDIRPENILFRSPLEVFLVDADGFQIEGFPSRKGSPYFTPPEMQNIDFATKLRTFGNEHFGVAALVFKILMHGRDAYSNTMDSAEELTVAERIRRMRFPYDTYASVSARQAPIGIWANLWSHMPFKLKEDFIDTFDASGKRNSEKTRYSTIDWLSKMTRYHRLLVDGTLYKQDPMSTELFPTRPKHANLDHLK